MCWEVGGTERDVDSAAGSKKPTEDLALYLRSECHKLNARISEEQQRTAKQQAAAAPAPPALLSPTAAASASAAASAGGYKGPSQPLDLTALEKYIAAQELRARSESSAERDARLSRERELQQREAQAAAEREAKEQAALVERRKVAAARVRAYLEERRKKEEEELRTRLVGSVATASTAAAADSTASGAGSSGGAAAEGGAAAPAVRAEVMQPFDPLIKAAKTGDAETITEVLFARFPPGPLRAAQLKAYVDRADANGSTALFHCAWNGHANVINVLLSANANPNIQNLRGNTALHLICERYYFNRPKFAGMQARAGSVNCALTHSLLVLVFGFLVCGAEIIITMIQRDAKIALLNTAKKVCYDFNGELSDVLAVANLIRSAALGIFLIPLCSKTVFFAI